MPRASLLLASLVLAAMVLCTFSKVPNTHAAGADGTWMPQWAGAPAPRVVVFDPHKRRLVGFGSANGSPASQQVWVLPVDGGGSWTPIPTLGSSPKRFGDGSTFTFDPVRGRFLLYGGFGSDGIREETYGELWALTIGATAEWMQLAGTSTRHGHTAVYDSVGDRLIVHAGGYHSYAPYSYWSYAIFSDVIAYDAATNQWTTLQATGAGPGPRYFHTATFDQSHRRMWVYGGGTGSPPDGRGINNPQTDLWSLNLAGTPAWEFHASPGALPAEGWHGILAMDAAESKLMLLHDGNSTTTKWHRDVSQGSSWTSSAIIGVWPAAYAGLGEMHDRAKGRALLLDYYDHSLSTLADTPGASIQPGPIPVATPAPIRLGNRQRAVLAHDVASGSTYLFGGDIRVFDNCSSPHGASFNDIEFNDLWQVASDPAASSLLISASNAPPARSGHAMIVDRRRRLIVFGGRYSTWSTCATSGGDAWLADIAFVDLAAPTAWGRITPSGTGPGAWAPDAAVYDNRRDRMLILGQTPADDVWELELSPTAQWRSLACVNVPAGSLTYRAAVLDSVGDRVLVHGLTGDRSLWSLSLSTLEWTQLSTTGVPPPAVSAATRAVFDPRRRRMIVYHGTASAQPLYELPLAGPLVWRAINQTEGLNPSSRHNPAVAYDVSRDRIIITSGLDPTTYTELGDVHVLAQEFTTTAQASVASATATHGVAEIFWDVTEIPADVRVESSDGVDRNWLEMGSPTLLARDRLYFKFVGLPPGAPRGFRLSWSESGTIRAAGEVWVTPSRAQQLALAMPGVTQRGAIPRGVLTLGESGEAHLEILDISGRRLGPPRRFAPTADAIPVSFDELHNSDAGVFWVRVRQGNATVTKRFIRLP